MGQPRHLNARSAPLGGGLGNSTRTGEVLEIRHEVIYRRLHSAAPVSGDDMAAYTSVNYALMCLSVVLIGGLVGGLVYLCIREIEHSRQKQKQQVQLILQRRRQGFSGQSGGCQNYHFPADQEAEDGDSAWEVDTQPPSGTRLQVPSGLTAHTPTSDDSV